MTGNHQDTYVDVMTARRAHAEQLQAELDHQRRLDRAIRNGLLLSLPIWSLVGVLVWWWLQ